MTERGGSVKRITALIAAVLLLAAMAAGVSAAENEKLHSIKFISSVDTESGKGFIRNSQIDIYRTENDENKPFLSLHTDDKGEAAAELPEGRYYVSERKFEFSGREYLTEDMVISVEGNTTGLAVYLKHSPAVSVISGSDGNSDAVAENDGQSDIPYTGGRIAAGVISVFAVSAAAAAYILATGKKRKRVK